SALSSITPPVAVTAYIGAGIAGANPIRTAMTACFLGLPAFIVPYMFMFSNSLLLQGEAFNIIISIIVATGGFFFISSSIIGFFKKNLTVFERVAFIVGGGLLLHLHVMTGIIGVFIIGLTLIIHYRRKSLG